MYGIPVNIRHFPLISIVAVFGTYILDILSFAFELFLRTPVNYKLLVGSKSDFTIFIDN